MVKRHFYLKSLRNRKMAGKWMSEFECHLLIVAVIFEVVTSGLSDGLFSNQKSQFWVNFGGLKLENVDIFYGYLEYFADIWDIL
jgi:hypothetical protein